MCRLLILLLLRLALLQSSVVVVLGGGRVDVYRPGVLFSRRSRVVSVDPSHSVRPSRSVADCASDCSALTDRCQALVHHGNWKACYTFTKRFKRKTDLIPSNDSVYLEKYPPAPSQIVAFSGTSSCVSVSPTCMLMSADGGYVAIVNSSYSKYVEIPDLTRRPLTSGQTLSSLFVGYSPATIDNCVGFDSGRTVYVISDRIVHCFQYGGRTYAYCNDWSQKSMADIFGPVLGSLAPGPYLVLDSLTYLFMDGQVVDSNGAVYVQGLGSPFANYPSHITGISETDDPNAYLIVSGGHRLYAYYLLEKNVIRVGNVCA